MDEINADIFGFVETKVNSQLQHVRTKFHQYARKIWPQSKLHFGHSDVLFEGPDKPGGLLLGLTRRLVGRCRAPLTDPFGRWCSMSLLGRDNRLVHVIVAYQVVQDSGDHGDNTLYEQQRALYRAAGHSNPNPKGLFIQDLAKYVSELQQADHDIILMGDFNEEIGLDAQGMQVVLDAGGLTDCHVFRHGLETERPTYARGPKRVDYMFVSSRLVPHLKCSGIEPFNHRIFSDHRGLFVDLRLPGIFDRAPVAIASPSERHVRTDVPPLIIKYVNAFSEYCDLHDVYARAQEMLESDEPCHDLAESVERDILRGMLHAELKCKSYQRLPWSEDVHTAMTTLHILKRRLSSLLTGYDMSAQIDRRQRSLPEPIVIPETYADTVKAIRQARRRCREVAKKARELREEYHQLRIKALQAQFPDKDPKKLETQYLRAQDMKNMYRRIPSAKPKASGGLSMLKVPRDPTADPKSVSCDDESLWKMIQDPEEIERTLLQRNIQHFGQAKDTPLAAKAVRDAIGWGATTATAEALLDGTFDVTQLTDDPQAQRILRHCRRKAPPRSVPLTLPDFQKKIKLWRESTSTSPSGRHLSHYHALFRPDGIDQDDPLFEDMQRKKRELWMAHFSTLSYAEKHGYCFDLWKTVVTAMLEKEPGNPMLHRLRVIHLYEAVLNAFLGIKYRDLLHYAEDNGLLNPGCYGSRPHRQALDPVLLEILQYDYVLATRYPHLKFSNDATACYDRMLAHITVLIARAFGLDASVAAVQGNFLEYARYLVKTMLGVSKDYYQHDDNAPIFGNGQGSTSSPPAWGFDCSTLFDIYEEQCHGAEYFSPDRGKRLKLAMAGFVDDNNSQVAGTPSTTIPDLVARASHDAQLWRDILFASGGDLELPKCYYHLLHVDFTSKGLPTFRPGTFGPPLQVRDSSGSPITITQMSFATPHKILGSYQAPVASQRTQAAALQKKATLFARTLSTSHVQPHEAWIYYYAVFLKSVGFPLAVSHLSPSQLDTIQKKMVCVTLQKMRYCSTMSRAIVFGPSRFSGIDFRDLRTEQGIDQVRMILRHLRIPGDQGGDMLRITLESCQYAVGTQHLLLEDPSVHLPHLESFWLKSVRSFLHRINASLLIADVKVQPLQRVGDTYLMDVALQAGCFSDDDVRILNACRLFLQVLTVSDIATADGQQLLPGISQGLRSSENPSRLMEPRQDRPADKHWAVWRRFLRRLSDPKSALRKPLGPWLEYALRLRRSWRVLFSPRWQCVVVLDSGRYHYHPRIRSRVFGRQALFSRDCCSDGIPISILEYRDGFCIPLVTPGVVEHPPAAVHPTFEEFLYHQPEYIATALSRWRFLVADVFEFCDSLSNLSTIVLATDGGAIPESYGAFGWIVADRLTKRRLAEGSGPALGRDPRSYRSENYGSWAGNLFIQKAFEFTGRPLPRGHLKLCADNLGMIKKLKWLFSYPLARTKSVLDSEWDVLQANHSALAAYPDQPTLQHIKGHQDKHVAYDSLSFLAQLNVDADRLCTAYLEECGTLFPRVPFDPGSKVQLIVNGHTVTRRLEATLRATAHLPALRAYYCERFDWRAECFDLIDWESFGSANKKNHRIRNFLTKLSFNLLPTGDRLHRRDPKYDDRCPCCLLPNETDDHLFQCTVESRQLWRRDLCLLIDKEFDSYVDPDLLRLLHAGMLAYFTQQPLDSSAFPDDLQPLIRQQSLVGWNQLLRGKFVEEWRFVQSRRWSRARYTPKPHEASWLPSLISLIMKQSHTLWLVRCKIRHGDDAESRARLKRHQAERELRELYRLRSDVLGEDRSIFRDDVETHLQASTTDLVNWLAIHRPLIRRSVRASRKLLLKTMPPLTKYFPPLRPATAVPPKTAASASSARRRGRRRPRKDSFRSQRLTDYFAVSRRSARRSSSLATSSGPVAPPSPVAPRPRPRQRLLTSLWPDHPG